MANIGFDIDGILASYSGQVRKLICGDISDIYNNDAEDYDFDKLLSIEQQKLLRFYRRQTDIFWTTMPVCNRCSFGDILKINELSLKHNIYFISRASSWDYPIVEIRTSWLRSIGIYCGSVICTPNKSKTIDALGVDMFVEDCPTDLVEINRNENVRLYGMRYTYNEKIEDYNNYPDIRWIDNLGQCLRDIDE